MTNKELIKKAIIAHFACDKNNLKCNSILEDSVDAAQSFFIHLSGTQNETFDKLIQRHRYKVKFELIKRYIKNS